MLGLGINASVNILGNYLLPTISASRFIYLGFFCQATCLLIKKVASAIFTKIPEHFIPLFSIKRTPSRIPNLNTLSLEEKIGQLLMVCLHKKSAGKEAAILIKEAQVVGFIYYNFSLGLYPPKQIRDFNLQLQNLTKTPLFIAVKEERGPTSQLSGGFTTFPGNRALRATENSDLAKKQAVIIAKELLAVGINMTLDPVFDVDIDPKNPIIGFFGNNPETVYEFEEKTLKGFHEEKMITTLNRYRGQGATSADFQANLLPFEKLAKLTDAITAPILTPYLEGANYATIAKKTLDRLRDQGFQGIFIADRVLSSCTTIEETAIEAINAGYDTLVLGSEKLTGQKTRKLTSQDIIRIHKSLVTAVQSGRILESRINEAVKRILALKKKYLSSVKQPDLSIFLDAQSKALAIKIATLGIHIKIKTPEILTFLHLKRICILAPTSLKQSIERTSLAQIGKTSQILYYRTLNPSNEEREFFLEKASEADILLIFSYNAWKNLSQQLLIESLSIQDKPLIILVIKNPIDSNLFPRSQFTIIIHSPAQPCIQAIANFLAQRKLHSRHVEALT